MPGQGGRARQVLAQTAAGPSPDPTPERPPSARLGRGVLLLVAVLVIGAASVGVDPDRTEPAPEQVAPEASAQVQATSELLSQDRLRLRVLVEVRIEDEPVTTGLPRSGASPAQVRLQGLSAPGLVVRLVDRPVPVLLGHVGRFGSGLQQVVRLTADVVALGCAEPQRPRRLEMSVSRSTGSPSSTDVDTTLPVQDAGEVTQALEALVRRSCRGAGR